MIGLVMPWLAEDRTRLLRFREGDRALLAEVYRWYAPGLAKCLQGSWRFEDGGRKALFRGCDTPFELDDLVQETFIRAFAHAARLRYDGLRPFAAYLFGIAQLLLIESFRKRHRRQRLFEVDPEESQPLEESSPETSAIGSQLREVYRRFVSALTPADRTLVQLRFEQDAPRRAVEEATGYSAMQVRTRESKLRAALFARLDSDLVAPGTNEEGGSR